MASIGELPFLYIFLYIFYHIYIFLYLLFIIYLMLINHHKYKILKTSFLLTFIFELKVELRED